MYKCLICGKDIKSKKVCSPKCYGKYRSIYFIGKNNPKFKQQVVKCLTCGKEISVQQYIIKSGYGIHCSRECADKDKFRTMGLEKNYNWKGGRYVRKDGYVRINIGGKRVLEHRLILGVTDPNQVVHHIDENPSNNSKENLQITTKAGHNRIHYDMTTHRFRKKA